MRWKEKLRGELIDIIEWIDDSRHTIVWRFPRFHNQIKNGAQLIVRPGQQAIFVHQGKVADVFGPGQHRLETKNLPILSTLLGWKYGFDSPFKAEVYFVNTTQMTDLKWGTPNPVIMRDPDFGPVRVRAFGTYTLKALDPPILLRELVGTDGDFETDEVSELLRSMINSAFAEVVAASGISVLDLSTRYEALSDSLREMVAEQIDDEYGLEVPQLFVVNISLPQEVERAIDARSSMAAIGDLGHYQAYQIGKAMPAAAANPGGGEAAAGLSAGLGMAMAMPAMQHMQRMTGAAPGSQVSGPPALPAQWHIAPGGRQEGPLTTSQLRAAVIAGTLTPDTLVWTPGMSAWEPAAHQPALTPIFTAAPPPLP